MSPFTSISYGQLMRGGLQRYLFPALLTVALVALLRYSFHPFSPTSSDGSDMYRPPPKTEDGQFRWSDVPVRYAPESITPLPSGQSKALPRVQHKFDAESTAEATKRKERQAAVKSVFLRAWESYKLKAWLKDELAPISGSYRNTFGGWAATLVDSLDTLHMMGLMDDFEMAVSALEQVDFGKPDADELNTFETTIRYLGGFLSAYDLSGDPLLLDKAVEVGDMLYVAFDTPNRMPITRWQWRSATGGLAFQKASPNTLVAEIGSLTLEFTRLSQVTNNPKWFDAVQRISELLLAQQNATRLPGMWPVIVNAETADFTSNSAFTLGGMSDSLYEYFPKQFALLGGLDLMYRNLYMGSMKTVVDHALFRPMVPDEADILISGNVRADNPEKLILDPQGQHLTCFAGGMFALGGRLFEIPTHVDIGRKLTSGCIWAYNASPLGIMPETFHMVPCTSQATCPWSESAYHAAIMARTGNDETQTPTSVISTKRLPLGFSDIGDRRYILRPEAIESVFLLYRITGDPSLQETAWKMFETIDKHTKTKYANAAIDDVTEPTSPSLSDRMESFWTAETLKYFYLIFSDPNLISLDEYVFNTEAHPFRRPTPV